MIGCITPWDQSHAVISETMPEASVSAFARYGKSNPGSGPQLHILEVDIVRPVHQKGEAVVGVVERCREMRGEVVSASSCDVPSIIKARADVAHQGRNTGC